MAAHTLSTLPLNLIGQLLGSDSDAWKKLRDNFSPLVCARARQVGFRL